ncbi:MAG: hypothetical protein E7409_03085 [Ruminococcaceae bacterium]|nr:hypothetical protein [Oscillospiraceae bacterium]
MKKRLYQTIRIDGDRLSGEERTFFLDYFLTEREYKVTDKMVSVCYGVGIEKRYFDENTCAEWSLADGFQLSEQGCMDLLDFLSQHIVTPTSLNEVLEDLNFTKTAC